MYFSLFYVLVYNVVIEKKKKRILLYSLSVLDVLDKNNWKQYHQWQSEVIKCKQIYLFAGNFICLLIIFSFIDCRSIAINRLHPEQLPVAIIDIETTLGRLNRWGINFCHFRKCWRYLQEICPWKLLNILERLGKMIMKMRENVMHYHRKFKSRQYTYAKIILPKV